MIYRQKDATAEDLLALAELIREVGCEVEEVARWGNACLKVVFSNTGEVVYVRIIRGRFLATKNILSFPTKESYDPIWKYFINI
jgi:hypothetical protein